MPEPAEFVLLVLRVLLVAALYAFFGLLLWVLLREPSASHPAAPAASLVRVDSDGHPLRRYPIRAFAWIGRDPNCSVRIDDGYVSARHARIVWEAVAGLWWLEDSASRNGTWLNGERVARAPLKAGDQLAIGDARFLFETTDNRQPTPDGRR